MFRRLVERFNAVPPPKLMVAGVGILYFGFFSSWYVDDWVDRYIERQEQNALDVYFHRQKQNAWKDTSGLRDGH